MKKSVIFIIILLAVALAGYVVSNCLIKKGDNLIIIARDLKTDDLTLLKNGNNFVWQGAIPGRIAFYSVNSRNVKTFSINMKPAIFEKFNEDIYNIKININIVYSIDENKAVNYYSSHMNESGNIFNDLIEMFLKGNFAGEIEPYIYPRYRREDIIREKDKLVEKMIIRLKFQSAPAGIEVSGYEIIGEIALPDSEIFTEGLNNCRELRENEKNNKKELIILNGQLEREKLFNKAYFERLSEISKLISANPDLLKYIYVDKLSDNVKVIIAPEKTGISLGLEGGDNKKQQAESSEIDNLK